MGCCHLLTIQQVTEVNAVRTEVLAGGKFTCSKDTWEMDPAEAVEAFKHRACTSLADCRNAVSAEFGMVARHWDDHVDLNAGKAANFLAGSPQWQSGDMLTTYSLLGHYSDRRGIGPLLGATATRTSCKVTEPPYPQSTPLQCKSRLTDFDVPKGKTTPEQASAAGADPGEEWVGEPETVSKLALVETTQRWDVTLLSGPNLMECSKPRVNGGKEWTLCEWNDSIAMQSFSIQMERAHKRLGGAKGNAWTISRATGIACNAQVP
jgi:hypothetical protein